MLPISAQLRYNVDVVCEYLANKIPVPVRNFTSPPQMIVIRSFDVNRPGSEVDDIKGGVAGGSILEVCPLLPVPEISRSMACARHCTALQAVCCRAVRLTILSPSIASCGSY